MVNLTWDYLSKGDTVDIVAPASHSPQEKLARGLEWFESLGLHPRVPSGMIQPEPFFAASLEVQFEQLKAALNSDSKAIWCLRGGYGSMRLIPLLKKLRPPKKPKLFVGFSDITALHLFFNQTWKWPTLHGRTISQLDRDRSGTPDRQMLKQLIFGEIEKVELSGLIPLNEMARKKQKIVGKVTGGNLSLLQSSISTPWEIHAKGSIVFIEDVSERGYKVDRMLEQLYQAKLINQGLRALIIGDFSDSLEKDGKDLVPYALEKFASKAPYPVFIGLKSGHGEFNYPLPFNTKSIIQNNCLVLESGGRIR